MTLAEGNRNDEKLFVPTEVFAAAAPSPWIRNAKSEGIQKAS